MQEHQFHRLARLVLSVLPFAFVLLLSLYVASEDTYVDDGRSRWERYGSGPQALFWCAVAVNVLASVMLSLPRPSRARIAVGLVLLVTGAVLTLWTFVRFTVN